MYNFSYNRDNRGFDWGALISGILMVIVGLLLLRHPDKGLQAFVLIFGILSIVQGVVWLAGYFRFRLLFQYSWAALVAGILDILVGIMFLGSYEFGGLTLAFLFATWFMVDSIVGIVFAWHLKFISNTYFIFNLIMNILSLIIAFMLVLNPVLAILSLIWLVAFWLIVTGVNLVVVAWMHR